MFSFIGKVEEGNGKGLNICTFAMSQAVSEVLLGISIMILRYLTL